MQIEKNSIKKFHCQYDKSTIVFCKKKTQNITVCSYDKWIWLVGWLSFTSHRQRGHLETAPPFPVPCEGREAR